MASAVDDDDDAKQSAAAAAAHTGRLEAKHKGMRARSPEQWFLEQDAHSSEVRAFVRKLLAVLNRLVDAGNTIVVIEHNLDVIKTADWVIDLGPEGGERGGSVVATGTPEDIVRCKRSHTGRYLRPLLPARRRRERRSKVAAR